MFITDVCFSPTPQEIPVWVCGGGGGVDILWNRIDTETYNVNFFDNDCPTKSIRDTRFGIMGNARGVMIVNRCSIEVHGVATKKD